MLRKFQTKIPRVSPQYYISKLVNQLALSGDNENIALKILDKATELRLTSGRGPAGIAAAATYIATMLTGEKRTQGDLAQTVHVTEVTIRNRYKEIVRLLDLDLGDGPGQIKANGENA